MRLVCKAPMSRIIRARLPVRFSNTVQGARHHVDTRYIDTQASSCIQHTLYVFGLHELTFQPYSDYSVVGTTTDHDAGKRPAHVYYQEDRNKLSNPQ